VDLIRAFPVVQGAVAGVLENAEVRGIDYAGGTGGIGELVVMVTLRSAGRRKTRHYRDGDSYIG